MILLPFWFDICLVHISKLLDIGETVDEKSMRCVERMTIHLVEGVSGRVGISEFNKSISMRAQPCKIRGRCVGNDLPIAFSSLVVPWHRDIIGLYCGTFSCKRFRDFCQKFLKF